jgi:hypothetical protein
MSKVVIDAKFRFDIGRRLLVHVPAVQSLHCIMSRLVALGRDGINGFGH